MYVRDRGCRGKNSNVVRKDKSFVAIEVTAECGIHQGKARTRSKSEVSK